MVKIFFKIVILCGILSFHQAYSFDNHRTETEIRFPLNSSAYQRLKALIIEQNFDSFKQDERMDLYFDYFCDQNFYLEKNPAFKLRLLHKSNHNKFAVKEVISVQNSTYQGQVFANVTSTTQSESLFSQRQYDKIMAGTDHFITLLREQNSIELKQLLNLQNNFDAVFQEIQGYPALKYPIAHQCPLLIKTQREKQRMVYTQEINHTTVTLTLVQSSFTLLPDQSEKNYDIEAEFESVKDTNKNNAIITNILLHWQEDLGLSINDIVKESAKDQDIFAIEKLLKQKVVRENHLTIN